MSSRPALSPRAARTRAALIEAGFALLAQRPIDAIPIDDVVAHAGVAKGSFFNHFEDKKAFAQAIATDVRQELEDQITRANAGTDDPVERLARGLLVCAEFALAHPKRALVLLRHPGGTTNRRHPLNQGLSSDIDAARVAGLLRAEADDVGVLFWLGLCQVLMTALAEQPPAVDEGRGLVAAMLGLGLAGLGIAPDHRDRVLGRLLPGRIVG